ncbi:cytochrome c biogenesis protein [Puniceicoccaceae bacterium K14]|nr:cytochrome c biogenesis protein [Puniceicoccaceae bacterium K14]
MKQVLPAAICLLALTALAVFNFTQQTHKSEFDLNAFGKLPAMRGEEIESFDTIARKALFSIHEKTRIKSNDGKTIDPIQWFADVLMRPEHAKTISLFSINNEEILRELDLPTVNKDTSVLDSTQRFFGFGGAIYFASFKELDPHIEYLATQARVAMKTESKKRTNYQNAVIDLSQDIQSFTRISQTLRYQGSGSFEAEISKLQEFVPQGMKAFGQNRFEEDYDHDAYEKMSQIGIDYQNFEYGSYFLPIPSETHHHTQWDSMGKLLKDIINDARPGIISQNFARLLDAYNEKDSAKFNQQLAELQLLIKATAPSEVQTAKIQQFINKLLPIKTSIAGYILTLALATLASNKKRIFLKPAVYVTVIATFALHSISLFAQNHSIDGYASEQFYYTTLFVGWTSALIGTALSFRFKTIAGINVVAIIGLVSLITASDLSRQDYSLYMKISPIALSNHWQLLNSGANTISYAATILAGILSAGLSILKALRVSLNQGPYIRLMLMSFYSLCLATISGIVGIICTCILSDVATGLYWQWTPEENGKLILLCYNTSVLLAYLDKQIAARGYVVASIFGTIIAVWSIIGIRVIETQEIGKSFWYFVGFASLQLFAIALAFLPRKYWKNRMPI